MGTEYWGTDWETYRVVSEGVVWVISHETGDCWVGTEVPADAVPLSEGSVADLEWPQAERGW